MPLVRIPEPFDHPDWLFELKHDGFRALAHVDGHQCQLVSRRGHVFRKWDVLCTEISHGIRAMSAVLDGEIVSLEADADPVIVGGISVAPTTTIAKASGHWTIPGPDEDASKGKLAGEPSAS